MLITREFSLNEIDSLGDGDVSQNFSHALQLVLADCENRPAVQDARKITLQMEVVPVMDEDGHLCDISCMFAVKEAIPTRKSKTYSMEIRRKSGNQRQLLFMAESHEDELGE